MPNVTGLDERMSKAIDGIGEAEILVGIPSFRNAGTIGHVARTVAEGLARGFTGSRYAVVNADGGSNDGTRDRVAEALADVPHVTGTYVGLPGKGSAFRAIFEAATRLGARACAVVDSDLRSITPEWVDRLLTPIVRGDADYVTPLYARHKHDGTITNTIAYPLTRALYGKRVRQPIGGEFGFSGELAKRFLEGGALGDRGASGDSGGDTLATAVWGSDVARFGIDIYMTTTALVSGARVAQAFLGAKVHDPKDPGADLAPMFRQVVGTAFRMAALNDESWSKVSASRDVDLFGDATPVEPEEIPVDPGLLVRRFREGAPEYTALWNEALSPPAAAAVREAREQDVPHALAGGAWATIVYDVMVAAAMRPSWTETYVTSLVPLYLGRVAALVTDAKEMTTTAAERLIEEQAAAFEDRKGHLRERWAEARQAENVTR